MAENSAGHGSAAAAARGFDAGLTMLLAAAQRDTPAIAEAIRRRIEVEERAAAAAAAANAAATTSSSSGTAAPHAKLREMYAAAATHLALLSASYPSDEAAWLVTTAGCHAAAPNLIPGSNLESAWSQLPQLQLSKTPHDNPLTRFGT